MVSEGWITKQKEARKARAIEMVKVFAQDFVDRYEEPSRAGRARTDPIGLSVPKYHAAFLMPLHPNALTLREIGEMVGGTSEGTIRVWRTKDDFKKTVEEAFRELTRAIMGTFEELAEGKKWKDGPVFAMPLNSKGDFAVLLAEILPYLNPSVSLSVAQTLAEKPEEIPEYFLILMAFYKDMAVNDTDSLRQWHKQNLPFTKGMLNMIIDLLVKPDFTRKEELADYLKGAISTQMDILAG